MSGEDVITVRRSGPLFDGRFDTRMLVVTHEIEYTEAQRALALVRGDLQRSIRNGTGHYEGAISLSNRASSMVVSDGGIVYGPWLEGVSTRNQTTRFKGYAAFRRATEALKDSAGQLAEDLIGREIGAMR